MARGGIGAWTLLWRSTRKFLPLQNTLLHEQNKKKKNISLGLFKICILNHANELDLDHSGPSHWLQY
jgi:hypothetical protein